MIVRKTEDSIAKVPFQEAFLRKGVTFRNKQRQTQAPEMSINTNSYIKYCFFK